MKYLKIIGSSFVIAIGALGIFLSQVFYLESNVAKGFFFLGFKMHTAGYPLHFDKTGTCVQVNVPSSAPCLPPTLIDWQNLILNFLIYWAIALIICFIVWSIFRLTKKNV